MSAKENLLSEIRNEIRKSPAFAELSTTAYTRSYIFSGSSKVSPNVSTVTVFMTCGWIGLSI